MIQPINGEQLNTGRVVIVLSLYLSKNEKMQEEIESPVIRRDPKAFDGSKPFVPKGFQVAERVNSPQVKLLKSLKRKLSNLNNNRFILVSSTTIMECNKVIDKEIEKVKKSEGSFIQIPKAKR